MRPTLYQASRMLTTAGVVADVKFDPTKITNRLRKSIQRQITNGSITGGYSSHASRIAKVLCTQFKVPYIDSTWRGVTAQFCTEESQEKAIKLVQADLAAYLLDTDTSYFNPAYDKRIALEVIEYIKTGGVTDIRLHSSDFIKQMRQLASDSRTSEMIKHAQSVAAMLDSTTPISITQTIWER